MNKIYRVVWNEITATWVAVAEIAKGHGKRSGTVGHVVDPAAASLTLPRLKTLVASLALIGAIVPMQALAQVAANQLPTGGNVVAGTAAITQNAAVMNINQTTARAAIDWNTFNVGSAAQVNFNQPSSSSVTLNRVLDSNPSQIFGRINAPGQVFLTNPNGVHFAPGSSVNVGGLVATTHRIAVDDFMAGKTTFDRNGSTGSVINEGELKAALGGYIALLAPQVRNEGVIIAQAGTVALASGEAITLNFADNGTLAGLTATQSQIAALVENKNAVLAPGGLIILSAQAMHQLQGGVINNSGSLEASSLTEKGGKIWLEGDTITLNSGSAISATGATGGGEVLVGGGWQGSGDLRQATTVTMEAGATIDVSATKVGAGGTAVLWSDVTKAASLTTVAGTILAKGGAEGGDGGRIETSGHNVDIGRASVSASAPKGTGGLWLIDPTDATINQTVADSYATTLNGGTSVENVVTGDMTWSDNVTLTKNNGGDATLTLKATGGITLGTGSSITSSSGKLNTILWADSDNNEVGGIRLTGTASINTNGGALTMGGGSDPLSDYAVGSSTSDYIGIYFAGITGAGYTGTLNAGGGNISLLGKGGIAGAPGCGAGKCNFGIVPRGTIVTSGSGTITLNGIGGAGTGDSNHGVYVNGTVQTDSGAITITGVGGQSGSTSNDGIRVIGSVLSASGPISLTGTAGTGTTSYGINGLTSSIGKGALASSSSAISLVTDTLNLAADASVQSTGTLTIAPKTSTTTIGIAGGTGTLALTAANFSTNFANGFSGITIGSATAGAITVGGATTFNDSTTLRSNSTIALNGAITANENLTLTSNGAITQNAALGVTGTTSITAGSGNNITLNTPTNNFTGAVSVVSGNDVSLIDSDAMSLGAISAAGTVDIATKTGNLTLTGAVSTSNTSASAITLNAATDTAAATLTGGDIIVSGGSVTTGAGGRATLYSGSVSGSTGLTTLVGSGSGNFRYNSDETVSNYTAALGTGLYAIYREQPTVTITANNATKTYDGLAYSGGNGVSYGGFVNGDNSGGLGGALAYGGTSQGATNAGSYAITPSGLSSGLGYNLSFTNGSLSIDKADATVTANSNTVTYNGVAQSVSGFAASGLVNGETIAVLDSVSTSGGSGTNAGSYTHTASGTDENYNLSFTAGALAIDKANATVTANSNTVTYNGVAQSVSGFTASGLVNGETVAVLGGVTTTGGTGTNAGSYTHTASGTDENYNLSFTAGSLTIESPPSPDVPVVIPPVVDTSPLPPGSGSGDSGTGTGSGVFTGAGETGGAGGLGGAGSSNPLLNANTALVIPLSGSGEGGAASGQVGAGGISISLDTAPSGNPASGVQGGVVSVSVPKAMATAGSDFSFELPTQVRESLGTGVLQATLADGNTLPSWIEFNPATQRFEAGAVPDGGLPLQVLIRAGTTQVLVVISERAE